MYLVYNFIKEARKIKLHYSVVCHSIEVTKNFTTDVFSFSFYMVHDSVGSCENDISKLSRRKNMIDKFLEVFQLKIVSWRNDSALV